MRAEERVRRVPAWRALLGAARPFFALAVVAALFSLHPDFRHTFWSPDYLPNVMQQSARNIVLAVGLSFVILTGGIDLSVGSVMALSGVGAALALRGEVPLWMAYLIALPAAAAGAVVAARFGVPGSTSRLPRMVAGFLAVEIPLGLLLSSGMAGGLRMEGAILVGLGIGTACGLVNGLIVAVGRVPAFIATLGMLTAARGLTLYATGGSSVPATAPRFLALGEGWPLVAITLAVVVAGAVLLEKCRVGRAIMAVGGSDQAARLSGLDVAGTRVLAFLLSGLTAAVGAILVTAKFGTADTNAGTGAELDAIAAVVIGGASLSGGQGSITGALVGALTITVIQSGLVLVGVQDTLQPVILGAVIVLTVLVDQVRTRATWRGR